jgi:hypothetical protein
MPSSRQNQTEDKPKGRPSLPDDQRRVLVSARVLPKTKDWLESIELAGGHGNLGRALDSLAKELTEDMVAPI